MTNAGQYRETFTWLRRTTTKDATGQDVPDFPPNGTLWGTLEPANSSEAIAWATLQEQAEATIRLRQWPSISAVDRILHKRTGLVYEITGCQADYAKNETVLQVVLYRSQMLTGDQ